MTLALLVIVSLTTMALVCVAATGARALRDFSSHELNEICQAHKKPELFGEVLSHREGVALAVENLRVIGTGVASACGALAIWFQWGASLEADWLKLVIAGVVIAILLLATTIWIPHAVVTLWSEIFLFYTWRTWYSVRQIASPLVFVTRLFNAVVHKLAGRKQQVANEETVEDEIRSIVTEGHHGGHLEDEAREMIESVIEMGDVQVFEIMTPRTDMVSIALDTSWDETIRLVIEAGHTRIPVYNKNRDDVVGLLYSKDLLPELAKGPDEKRKSLAEILRKPYFVPETKLVISLLQEFRKSRNHIAVVLDEFGGVSGVVSIEDVLEEIVGEIADEYDDDLVDGIKQLTETSFESHARLRIDEINERLNLSLPEDKDFDTIGGLVFHELGRIPTVGEELVRHDVRIRVIDATRRRIDRVIIELVNSNESVATDQ